MKPYIASNLRDMNRKTVFDLIANVGEISRSEITQLTGISAPTVLKITNYLCDNGFIINAGEGQSALGRKPQMLRFNPNFAYSIGVEYEGDYLKMGIVNVSSEIILKKTIHVKNDFADVISRVLIDNVESLIHESGVPKNKIHGIGLGLPGAVDIDNNEIRLGPLVGVNNTYPLNSLTETITQSLNMSTYVCNDVNAASIGEYITRKLKNEDLVYISLGTGLGSGIILDGKLRFGKHFNAGEIGSLIYDDNFKTSDGLPGSLESLINIHALLERFKDFDNRVKNKVNINEIINYIAPYLGITILNIISIIDVKQVVLGGIIVDLLGEELITEVLKQFHKLSALDVNIDLCKSDEPGIIGASHLITNEYIKKIFLS